jgi:hypothetical protein
MRSLLKLTVLAACTLSVVAEDATAATTDLIEVQNDAVTEDKDPSN